MMASLIFRPDSEVTTCYSLLKGLLPHHAPGRGLTEATLVPAAQIPVALASRRPDKTATGAAFQTLRKKMGESYDPAVNNISGNSQVVTGEQEVKQVVLKRSWWFRPVASYN